MKKTFDFIMFDTDIYESKLEKDILFFNQISSYDKALELIINSENSYDNMENLYYLKAITYLKKSSFDKGLSIDERIDYLYKSLNSINKSIIENLKKNDDQINLELYIFRDNIQKNINMKNSLEVFTDKDFDIEHLPKDNYGYYILKGQDKLQKLDFLGAIESFQDALNISPDNKYILYFVALTKLKLNNFFDASEILMSFSENDFYYLESLSLLGYIKTITGDFEESIKYYDKSISLYNNITKTNYEDYFLRGFSYLKLNDYDKAIDSFVLSIRINPNFYLVYAYQAFISYNKFDFKYALLLFKKALNLMKNDSYIEYSTLFTFSKKEDYDFYFINCDLYENRYLDALNGVEDYLQNHPKDIQAYTVKALSEFCLGMINTSINTLDDILSIDSENINALLLKARIARKKTFNIIDAEENYYKLFSLGIKTAEVYTALIFIYLYFEESEIAIYIAKRFYEENQDDFLANYILGKVYQILGENDLAKEIYLKALEIETSHYCPSYIELIE
jgi:tetratricopeptide (TPR) repeat protein